MTTQQYPTPMPDMIETIFGTSDIFGSYLGDIVDKLDLAVFDGRYVFRSYFQKSNFMSWYASVALSKGKYNNSIGAIIKARDYYNKIGSDGDTYEDDVEIHNPTPTHMRYLLSLIEEVERDNETFAIDVENLDNQGDLMEVM